MDASVLLCVPDPALQKILQEKMASAGFHVVCLDAAPNLEKLTTLLPDLLILDMDALTDLDDSYLQTITEGSPSLWTLVIADPVYEEHTLFLTLKSGARGWIFKRDPEGMMQELAELLEAGHFLKPMASQLILEEFKSSGGETLLPLEEEILRQCARGLSSSQIQSDLKLSDKLLRSHWENIWQKLNINARAKKTLVPKAAPPVAQEVPAQGITPQDVPPKDVPPPKMEQPHVSAPQPLAHTPTSSSFQIVSFRLGSEHFALNISQLQEIQRMLPITPLPRVPDYVEGVINLRGRIVPVIDLRKKLGLQVSPPGREARIIVTNLQQKIVGMIVDSVQEVLRVDSKNLSLPPPLVVAGNPEFIQAVTNVGERLVMLLDLEVVLSGEKLEKQTG